MNRRQLKKLDKRAAAVLLTFHPSSVRPEGFGLTDEGRYTYEWRSSYDCNEWDMEPAVDFLRNLEIAEYEGLCLEHELFQGKQPRPEPVMALSPLSRLPAGYRWRGGRIVPVDELGGMVKNRLKMPRH